MLTVSDLHILGKADEILVVGVDVGELNVNEQQDLQRHRRNLVTEP